MKAFKSYVIKSEAILQKYFFAVLLYIKRGVKVYIYYSKHIIMIVKELGQLFLKFKYNVPWHVDWEITYCCQNRCRHCYLMHTMPDKQKEIPCNIIFKTLEELKELGTAEIGFTGGDPFLYSDFLDVIQYASKLGFNIIILTSGQSIFMHTISILKKCNISKMEFTFFGAQEETHDWFTRTTGSFKKMITAIDALVQHNIKCIGKMIVTKHNYHEIDQVRELCKNMKIDFSYDPHIWKPYDGTEEDVNYLRLSKTEMEKYYLSTGIELNEVLEIQMCLAGRNKIGITPEGWVNPCGIYGTKLIVGSLKENSIYDIWNNSEKLNAYRCSTSVSYPIKRCVLCPHRLFCDWCPGLSAWGSGNSLEPYDELCKDTILKEKVFRNNEKKYCR